MALDWRKTFDRIPLASVATVLREAGAPAWIAGPAAIYGAPRRHAVWVRPNRFRPARPAGAVDAAMET
eukprot:3019406-Lingulodinium_polyedra.AAC.1